jgi:hypothetical protein
VFLHVFDPGGIATKRPLHGQMWYSLKFWPENPISQPVNPSMMLLLRRQSILFQIF